MAYRADIEIGVKGADKLRELQERVVKLSRAVEDANVKTLIDRSAVQSVSEYTSVVAKAADTLRETAVQLNAAGKASGDYANAISQYVTALGQSNSLQKIQNNLIADEIELRRKQKLAQSGITETTQYGGPIGPGPASAIGTLAGQTSPVAERVQRIVQARKEEAQLQAALLRLEEKSASVLNEKVQAQQNLVQGTREVVELLQQQEQKTRFLAGTSGAVQGPLAPLVNPRATGFPVALPLTKAEQVSAELAARKQAILERTVTTTQELSGLAANLQRIEINSVVAIEDANRAKERAVVLAEKELAISKQGALVAGRFSPVGGAPNIPGSPAALAASSARRKEALSNAVIGGAFPLLFGQGAGAAVGGGLGGAAGGLLGGQFGFGLSLVGTAIGQAFDTASQSAKDFADALTDTGDATAALETALGKLDKETKTQISNLAKSGQQAAAAEASFDALAEKIGVEQAEAFQRAGKATSEWGSNLQTWLTKTYASLVLLGEEFDRVIFKLPGTQPPTSVFDIVEAAPQQQQLSQEAQDRIENLAGQNTLLEKQVALSRLTTDASIEQRLQLERQVSLQEYVNTAVELERQLKQKLLSEQEYNLRLKAAELNLTRDIYQLENDAQQERERRAKEARQAAEQAAKKQEQTIKSILGLQAELLQTSLQAADVDVEVAKLRDGQAGALKEEADQLNARFNVEARILQLQLDQKLASSDISAQEANLLQSVYTQQLANLKAQYDIRQALINQAQAELQLNKFIADEAVKQQALQPFEDLRKNRELEVQYSKTYLRLVTEGILPAEAERAANFERLVAEQLNSLDQQIAITNAALVQAEAYGASADKIKELREELERLQGARGAVAVQGAVGAGEGKSNRERLQEEIASVQGQLNTLLDPINQITTAAEGIGLAFSDSFKGIVSGTMTAQEALANFFQSVADQFLDMAAQMIAKWIQLTILNSILKLFPTGAATGSAASGGYTLPSGAGYAEGFSLPSLLPGRANGGPVTGGMPYIVGERGPELFVPGASGSIVPNNQLGSAGNKVEVGQINISVENTGESLSPQAQKQIAGQVRGIVLATLVDQQRSGGILR